MTEISGAVGYTLLKHNNVNENILLFSDIHDGVTYCEGDNSIGIHTLLDECTKEGITVFLEESLRRSDISLSELWQAEHTQALRDLNLQNLKIIPIDIRCLLIPFSWELYVNNKTDSSDIKITLREYLSILNDFFNFEYTELMTKYVLPNIRETFGYATTRSMLLRHFYYLKEIVSKYLDKQKKYLDYTLEQIITEGRTDLLEKINNILSMVMEWYIILLICNCRTNMIIHVGLAHSSNILELLTTVYQYNIKSQTGINKMQDLGSINTPAASACVAVPTQNDNSTIHSLFRKKYHFN
jgi:hypothetical protein